MRFVRSTLTMITLLFLGVALAPAASAQEDEPWIAVDKVMVDKLGGVSIEGRHSCGALYDRLLSGGIVYMAQNEFGQWEQRTITAAPDDVVVIGSNPDNYTVSQPVGRKTMIQVTHQSSRLQWCFSNAPAGFFDVEIPCDAAGAPCAWVTDRFSYSGDGPLFDYSPSGKFKAGYVNVQVTDMGYYVDVFGDPPQSAFVPNEAFASQTLRAVAYR